MSGSRIQMSVLKLARHVHPPDHKTILLRVKHLRQGARASNKKSHSRRRSSRMSDAVETARVALVSSSRTSVRQHS